MEKKIVVKSSLKAGWTSFALVCGLLVMPLFGALQTAEAKPPRHAPAWGYRAKKKNYSRSNSRRTTRYSRWNNRNSNDSRYRYRRSSTTKPWTRDTYRDSDSGRRYTIRYRTRYTRNGTPYREFYRSYR